MSREKMDVVLNVAAKIFFVLRQGTSTLMMDSLYSGWKTIEEETKKKKNRQVQMDNVELPAGPAPIVSVDQDMFVLVDDLLVLMKRTVMAPLIPIKEEKGSQNPSKVSITRYLFIMCGCALIVFFLNLLSESRWGMLERNTVKKP